MSRRNHYVPREQYSLFDQTVALRQEENVDGLPASARELVDVIGLDATIDLVKAFGGDEPKIPEVVDGASRMWALLVETVGRDCAAKLVERYGGTQLYIAKCDGALRRLRNLAIVARLAAGEDFDKVRRDANVSRRHLFRLLEAAQRQSQAESRPGRGF